MHVRQGLSEGFQRGVSPKVFRPPSPLSPFKPPFKPTDLLWPISALANSTLANFNPNSKKGLGPMKFRAFRPPRQFSFFHASLGGLLVELWPIINGEIHTNLHLGFSGVISVKPRAVPTFKSTSKIPREEDLFEGRQKENCGGRGEKKREISRLPPFGAPTLRGPTLRGPTVRGPTNFWPGCPHPISL